MALNKITYSNKVSLNPQPSVANENKVSDSDMNEIKSVVNSVCDEIDTLDEKTTPVFYYENKIEYIKYGHIVIMNGIIDSNVISGSITLKYKPKYYFGFAIMGYYPQTGNIQAYGYAYANGNQNTLVYKGSAAFSYAPVSAIYYTDDAD